MPACNGCDKTYDISSCAPYANRDDVIAALMELDACCVGEYSIAGNLNVPCASDNDAVAAVAEAFPDGIVNCDCPCVYLWDVTNNHLSVNCTGDLTQADNWSCDVDCIGHLTTVDLDPSADDAGVSAATAVLEGFPQGMPVDCEEAILFREDGTLCHSVDFGVTWSCGASGGASKASTPQQSNAQSSTCAGVSCCTAGTVINLTPFGTGNGGVLGVATATGTNPFAACVTCLEGIDRNFKVTQTGLHHLSFGLFTIGTFSIGSSGCPGCSPNGVRPFHIQLVESGTNTVVQQFAVLVANSGGKTGDQIDFEIILQLDSTQEYYFRSRISFPHTLACCTCGNGVDNRGFVTFKWTTLEFLE